MYLTPKIIVLVVTINGIMCATNSTFRNRSLPISLKNLKHPNEGEIQDVFVKLLNGVDTILQQASKSHFTNREQRLNLLHDQLVKHTDATQQKILEYLTAQASTNQNLKIRRFWATNQILVKGATREIIADLATRFQSEIQSIYPNEIVAHILKPAEVKNTTKVKLQSGKDELQWGLKKIQTQEAWKEIGITNGFKANPEIRIATIDTGVRHTHEALRDNFLGNYGWFDPTIGQLEPNDKMGHGSHTTATIAGSKGVGVAPWVKWMSCRGCPTLGCSLEDLLACGEFFLCPTLADGSSPDCSKAPHLISNSWSGGQGLDWYDDIINAWHAAGIIPIFSIGNMGNAFCRSANYPGDLPNVIAVGSTTEDDTLSWFSSIGPTINRDSLIKPDIVAPGSDILSATNTADDAYELMSGTSMSCPHVSGIVALLLTQNPQISFEEAKQSIIDSAQHNLQSRQMTCQDIPDTIFPNHVFGYGRVNALRSVMRSKLR